MNRDELIQRFLDGTASADEALELSNLIEAKPAAARQYAELAGIHAALMADETLRAAASEPAFVVLGAKRRFQWPQFTAAAASLVIGLLGGSLVMGVYRSIHGREGEAAADCRCRVRIRAPDSP